MTVTTRALYAENAGVRVHGLEWRPDAESGALPVVFVPGGTANAFSGEDLGRDAASGMVGRLRSFLSMSRRGTGESSAPASGYTPGDFANDLDALVRVAGYRRFVLFGHSMGVPITLEYALRYPAGVAGLVLGDAPAAYIDFKAAGTFDRVLGRPFEFPNADAALAEFGRNYPDPEDARRDFMRVGHRYFGPAGASVRRLLDRGALLQTVEESVAAASEYWPQLRGIACPALLLKGTGGDWSPLNEDDIARYERELPGIQVQRIPGGHQLGLFGDREPLRAAVGSFADALLERD